MMGRRSVSKNRRRKNYNGTKRKKKKKYIPKDRYIEGKVRREVRKRDGNRCVYCNKRQRRKYPLLKEIKLEFGHVIPHSKGGDKCVNNIQMECFDCNRGKGAKIKQVSLINRVILNRGAKGCKKHN